ncbi:MAG: hypothetical protein CVV57_01500 [Tenericutes bacterium HGW-Tenericutes-2]|jgi:hypothetical protein|nr:MAG: hypothetical protein CVV57_01500 [Tenericutes bacterium HGW-Tenericutes-2]
MINGIKNNYWIKIEDNDILLDDRFQEHIFLGQVSKGKPSGFHHNNKETTLHNDSIIEFAQLCSKKGKIVTQNTQKYILEIYCRVKGTKRPLKYSTMFNYEWSRDRVLQIIKETCNFGVTNLYTKCIKNYKIYYNNNGMTKEEKIIIAVSVTKTIKTAFPILKY